MPNVRMPNGTVISNVPEGTTKDQLLKKLSGAGYDVADLLTPQQEENALEKMGSIGNAAAWLADIPLDIVQGLAGTAKSVTDVAGADNVVSKFLGDVSETAGGLRSSEARRDEAINALAMDRAAKEGVWEQVKTAGSSFLRSPVDITANLVGSALPFLAAGRVGGTGLMAGLGALSGAGTIKGAIYDTTYSKVKEAGGTEEQAIAAAEKAQEYGSENLDQIALGAVIGAAASATGLPRQVSAAISKRAAAEVIEKVAATEAAEQITRKSLLAGGVKGAFEEAAPEALQDAQQRYAQNKALQRQGYAIDPMEGVVGQGAFAGISSLLLGGLGGVTETSAENLKALDDTTVKVMEELPLNPTDEQRQTAIERFTRWGINQETAETIVSRLTDTKRALAAQEEEAKQRQAEMETGLGETAPIEEEQFLAGAAPAAAPVQAGQVSAEEADRINREALDALATGEAAPAPTPTAAPVGMTPARAAQILEDPVALSDYEASGGDADALVEMVRGSARFSRGRPSKTTADEGLFGTLPTQEANRLDKAEEMAQLKLSTTPEERIAQQEEATASAAEQAAQRTKLDEEQRKETLDDIQYALRAQAPENAVYKVDYDPTSAQPYKLLAETQLGKKPEIVLSAPTLEEFSNQVYGQMNELTPYVPAPELSAQTVEEPDEAEPTIATDMIRQFADEVDTAHRAGRIDNNQRAELLGRLERPNAYRTLPNGQEKPNDAIAKTEAEANKAMEEFRAAENDDARNAATDKLAEINQRLTAAVQNGLLNPLRARMKTMVETRADERLGAQVRQREAEAELGKIEARPEVAQAREAVQNATTELSAAQAAFDTAKNELAAAEEVYAATGAEGDTGLLPDVRRQYARMEIAKAQVRKAANRLTAAKDSTRAAIDKLRSAEAGKKEAKTELREAKIDEKETKVQKYKRGEGRGISPGIVQQIVNDITSKWKSKVPVTVVATVDDLPASLRSVIEKDNAFDAKGFVIGDGTVYLIASNIATDEEARATLFHEGLGHIGLAKLFRDKLDGVLKSLYNGNKNIREATDKWLKENPGSYEGQDQIARAVEEVLAERSESGVIPQSIMQRLAAVIRDFARRLGFDLALTDGDVNAILAAAHKQVVDGKNVNASLSGVRYILGRKKPKAAQSNTTSKTKSELLASTSYVSDGLRRAEQSQTVYGIANGISDTIKGHSVKGYLAALKENWTGFKPFFFKSTLYSLPTSGIIDWFGKDIPALRRIEKLTNNMLNMKANIIAAGDEIATRLKQFVDVYGNGRLAKAQSVSRISEVAPDEFASMQEALRDHKAIKFIEDKILNNTNDKARARQLMEELKALVVEGKAREYIKEGSEQSKFTKAANKIVDELGDLAIDQNQTFDAAKQLSEMSHRIRDAYTVWEELGEQKGGQQLYKDMRQFYKDMFEAELALLDERISQVGDEEQVQRLRDERAKLMRETLSPDEAKKQGDVFYDVPADMFQKDYFPFMREGKYWLYVKGKPNVRERQFYTFYSAKERNSARDALARKMGVSPNDQTELSFGDDIATLQETFKNEDAMMQKVFDIVKKAQEKVEGGDNLEIREIRDAIYQTWLLTTPERSVRRRLMHADEVTGFSSDVLNHFSRQVTAYANQLSKMAYAGQIRNEVKAAYENNRTKDIPNDISAKREAVIQEIEARSEQEINPDPQSQIVNALNRASFFYYLTSAATALTQLTSVPIRVMPYLWSKYGFVKGTAMVMKYMKVWNSLGIAKTEKVKTGLGDQLHAMMPSVLGSSLLTKGPRAALLQRAAKAATERNLLQTVSDTLVQNEREAPGRQRTGAAGVAQEVADETAKLMSVMFNGMENISRQASFFMTFELAYDDYLTKHPGETEAAFNHAVEEGTNVVRDTLGDYSSFERPRLAKNNWTRALFLFKMYAVVQTKFFVKNFNAMTKGLFSDWGPEARAARAMAFKEMSGVVMMAGMFGGLAGMPLYSLMAYALAQGFDDEDDEDVKKLLQLDPRVAYDSDIMFRKWLAEKTGNPKAGDTLLADLLINGPISVGTNTDIGSRTSLDLKNMWFRETASESSTSASLINFLTANIAGAQMAVNIAKGYDQMAEGDVQNGLKKMLPAFFRSWVAAAQAADEGVLDSKGNVIIPKKDISDLDTARAVLGFRPMDLARWQDYYITRAKNEQNILSKKRRILDRLEDQVRSGEITTRAQLNDFIKEEVVPFNRTYPDEKLAITEDTIARSLKSRQAARELNVRGMQVNKKTAQRDIEMARPFMPK